MTAQKRHKFKWLTYKGKRIRIDQEIAPLLSKMWELGINTKGCCQATCHFCCNHKWKSSKTKDGFAHYELIETKNCYDSVWLAFESMKDLERLFNSVAEYSQERNSMYHLMNCDCVVRTPDKKGYKVWPDSWAFIFYMSNQGVYGHWGRPTWAKGQRSTQILWIEDGCKKNDFVMQPQITFPRKHIPYVEERLQLALDAKEKRKKNAR
jgi:hypothetical protein